VPSLLRVEGVAPKWTTAPHNFDEFRVRFALLPGGLFHVVVAGLVNAGRPGAQQSTDFTPVIHRSTAHIFVDGAEAWLKALRESRSFSMLVRHGVGAEHRAARVRDAVRRVLQEVKASTSPLLSWAEYAALYDGGAVPHLVKLDRFEAAPQGADVYAEDKWRVDDLATLNPFFHKPLLQLNSLTEQH